MSDHNIAGLIVLALLFFFVVCGFAIALARSHDDPPSWDAQSFDHDKEEPR